MWLWLVYLFIGVCIWTALGVIFTLLFWPAIVNRLEGQHRAPKGD